MAKRFIVTGGRSYDDDGTVRDVLMGIPMDWILVHGGASGADQLAASVWRDWGFVTDLWPADWAKLGRRAGPARNQEMVDAGAEFVIAFPGGRGTRDMSHRAYAAGIPVISVRGRDG